MTFVNLMITAAAAAMMPALTGCAHAAPAAAIPSLVQMDHVSIQAIGSGDPVVLIPGLATPRAVYARTAERLARTHRVLLVQVNGFGGDPAGANDKAGILEGVAGDIASYLERERLPKAAVIGHSMGGVIGMRLARDHPKRVARLMVVDALPFIGLLGGPQATVESMRPMAEMMRQNVVAAAARARTPSADDPSIATMAIAPKDRLQVSTWGVASDPRVVGQAMYEVMQEDLRPNLATIAKVPTTILYGVPVELGARADALWRGAYASAPGIRLVPVQESRHFIMLDQPERFEREVLTFLAG